MNRFVFVLSILLFSTSCNQVDSIDNQEPDSETEIESQLENINLNLRVHLMQSEPWVHPTGTEMSSWVTPSDIEKLKEIFAKISEDLSINIDLNVIEK